MENNAPKRQARFGSSAGNTLGMERSTSDDQKDGARFRFVWHLGFQKTGTSTFQELCRINFPILRDHVARFQRPQRTKALVKASHAFLSQESVSTRQIIENKVRRIREKTLAWDLTTAIISDEVLPGWVIYDDQDSVFTRLQRLMPVLEQSTPDCDHQFVFYTRDFNSWLTSGYWEKVRYGRQTQDLETWLDKVPFKKCWRVAQEELSSVVHSPVRFHDMYEDEKHGEPFGSYILRAAGVSRSVIDSLEWPERKNQSLPIGAQHFLLALNRSDLSNRALRIVRRLVAANQRCFSRFARADGPASTSDLYEEEKHSESLARYLLKAAGVSKRAINALEWPERRNQSFPHGTENFCLELDQSGLSNDMLEIVRQLVTSNQDCFSGSARVDSLSPSS